MGAKRFSDLSCWQLAVELKRAVYAITEAGPVTEDWRFRDQLRQAAASAPANIAEGFARYQHGDFARFLTIAIGSLDELENHLIDGIDRRYFSQSTTAPLIVLKRRTAAALTAFRRYLYQSTPPNT